MKNQWKLLSVLFLFSLFASCGILGGVSGGDPSLDGSSFEKAIIISSMRAEYLWIDKTYPGSSLLTQVVKEYEGKAYDIVTIKTKAGEEKKVYFDISRFYKSKQYNIEEMQ